MDKAYIFTPQIAAEIMMFSTVNAMIVTTLYIVAVKFISENYLGYKICKGIRSLFSTIRRKIHG